MIWKIERVRAGAHAVREGGASEMGLENVLERECSGEVALTWRHLRIRRGGRRRGPLAAAPRGPIYLALANL